MLNLSNDEMLEISSEIQKMTGKVNAEKLVVEVSSAGGCPEGTCYGGCAEGYN